jgi:hypothetical protein
MKKYTIIMMTSFFFSGIFQVLGADSYEVNDISEVLIGKLWKGYEVSEQDIETLFSTVEHITPTTHVKNYNDKEKIIKEWENEMLEYLNACHVNDPKRIEAIKDFSRKINKESNFSDHVINNSLRLILDAY